MSFNVGDVVTVTKLAYDVYSKGFLVARGAPEQFRELVQELSVYKDALYQISSQTENGSELTYDDPVRALIKRCLQTLSDFGDFIGRYEQLAWSDRGQFLKRLSWAKEQSTIEGFRVKFRDQQNMLHTVITAKGGRSIVNDTARRESKLTDTGTLVDDDSDEECSCETMFMQKQRSQTYQSSRTMWSPRPSLGSASLAPVISAESSNRKQMKTSQMSRRMSQDSIDSNSSNYATASDQGSVNQSSEDPHSAKKKNDLLTKLDKNRVTKDIDPIIAQEFKRGFELVKEGQTSETWLRVAVWWLIKARTVSEALAQVDFPSSRQLASPQLPAWECTVSRDQAYLDMLKSAWILEEIVLKAPSSDSFSHSKLNGLVLDLARSLHGDLLASRYRTSISPPSKSDILLKFDLGLFENFEQPVEALENIPKAMDDPDSPYRWFTVDPGNGGRDPENIIYRTFVNAQLGDRTDRLKSYSNPYMLVLWTSAGKNDFFVSLCNHRASLNLSRKVTREDVERCGRESVSSKRLVIVFPSQEAEIKFLNAASLEDFISRPRQYFAGLKEQDPLTEEIAIFHASISSYREHRSSVPTIAPTHLKLTKSSSCGLRLYETSMNKAWKTTRRLIITSAPEELEPACISQWLPLAHVRVSVDGTTLIMSWSDYAHLEEKKRGKDCDPYWSYVYKPDEPNRKIQIDFRNHVDAGKFRDCLLFLTETPDHIKQLKCLNTPSSEFETRVYRLRDEDEPLSPYHAVVSVKKTSSRFPQMADIYFVYRDIDFQLGLEMPSLIEFSKGPSVLSPHYLSTMQEEPFPPAKGDAPPQFGDVDAQATSFKFNLKCPRHDTVRFMKSLTGWKLKFMARLQKLVLSGKGLMKSKETHDRPILYLWSKTPGLGDDATQMTIRLRGDEKDRWLTSSLIRDSEDTRLTHISKRVELNGLAFQRGPVIDHQHMKAANHRGGGAVELKRGARRLALSFEDNDDEKDFCTHSGLFSRSQF